MVDGVKYWHVQNWKHTAEVLTGAHYQFENLFNGNKQLGEYLPSYLLAYSGNIAVPQWANTARVVSSRSMYSTKSKNICFVVNPKTIGPRPLWNNSISSYS